MYKISKVLIFINVMFSGTFVLAMSSTAPAPLRIPFGTSSYSFNVGSGNRPDSCELIALFTEISANYSRRCALRGKYEAYLEEFNELKAILEQHIKRLDNEIENNSQKIETLYKIIGSDGRQELSSSFEEKITELGETLDNLEEERLESEDKLKGIAEKCNFYSYYVIKYLSEEIKEDQKKANVLIQRSIQS